MKRVLLARESPGKLVASAITTYSYLHELEDLLASIPFGRDRYGRVSAIVKNSADGILSNVAWDNPRSDPLGLLEELYITHLSWDICDSYVDTVQGFLRSQQESLWACIPVEFGLQNP
jgi:hypothetical protein